MSFTVPAVNTDGSRPANVASTVIYAITVPVTVPPISDDNLLKLGTRIGIVEVKAPRDPNLTADADDPSDEVDPPEGPGLEQGAVARLEEPLTADMLKPVVVPIDKQAPTAQIATSNDAPLVGPPVTMPVRTYVAVGVSTRGRKGPVSKRVTVPLVRPPLPPSGATITYDEKAITVTWPPTAAAATAPDAGLLPSRVLGAPRPAIAYNVYDATNPDAQVKLTATPVEATTFSDARIVWGEKRCYVVATAVTVGGTAIESESSPPACSTPVDTFPPAAPKDLKAISSEGVINLIWEPNAERDLAGYIVFRAVDPAETLRQITPEPIVEPSFQDTVQRGVAYVYAVRAVDKAGNASDASGKVVETAR